MNTAKISVRNAVPSDARALNAYLRGIFATSKHLVSRADEFRMSPFRQRLWIAKKEANPFETCLIALSDKNIVGMLECWTDRRKRVRHVTTFSMTVEPDSRRQGIGRLMLETFTDWVAAHKHIEKIELHVHADNKAAIKLYETSGFTVEGKRCNAIKYEDGRSVDDILMAYWPNSSIVE